MSEMTDRLVMTEEQAEAFRCLVEASNRGDGDAACRLGDKYREGLDGLRASPRQAFRWYSCSALAGDAFGQNNLGACYEHGLGCRQSYAKAVKWYRLAAARQHGTASMNLGYCYLRGKGLPADKEEALRLFRLAVEQGEQKAADELERLGEPVREMPVRKKSAVRLVYETQPGRNVGIVGTAGVTPPKSGEGPDKTAKSGWTSEDFYRVSLRAWEKDDCFDLPEPGSVEAIILEEDLRRFWRHHAAQTPESTADDTP